MKHTPGPWKITAEKSGSGYILAPNGMPVTQVSMDKTETMWANAHLIAAAPELLEGAKACVAMLISYKDESSKFAASFLTKAIAKAEGRSK